MSLMTLSSSAGEFTRYAIVGLVSNAVLFVLYLLVTKLGMGHKSAATLAYGIGVVQTFAFNKSWSFRDRGATGPAFFRYTAVYVFGYLFNMLVLVVLVDHLGFRHELIQGATILILAVMIYAMQKFWVFRGKASDPK
jgi:putative flippase GtrA